MHNDSFFQRSTYYGSADSEILLCFNHNHSVHCAT